MRRLVYALLVALALPSAAAAAPNHESLDVRQWLANAATALVERLDILLTEDPPEQQEATPTQHDDDLPPDGGGEVPPFIDPVG